MIMTRTPFLILTCLVLALSGTQVFNAAEPAGNATAKAHIIQISLALETALRDGQKRGLLEDDTFIDDVINRYIIPHIDQDTLSRRIFTPRWHEIVAKNKTQSAYDAVIQSLRRTYRFALSTYDGQKIEILNSTDKAKYSVVRVFIRNQDRGHTIDFALKKADDRWQIFDLSVDGVGVSKTLNSSLKRIMASQDIEAVISAINPKDEP